MEGSGTSMTMCIVEDKLINCQLNYQPAPNSIPLVSLCSREDFGRIPELAINPLNERIIDSFYFNSNENEENE